MNDWTPTDEHVRATFAYVTAGLDHDEGYAFEVTPRAEDFDRWLAAHDREVKAEAWDKAIHHVEPMLGPGFKRAAMSDNPYRGGTP